MNEGQFKKGRDGENYIADKFIESGFRVIHVGGATKHLIDKTIYWEADLLAYKGGRCFWVQAKNKEPRKFYPDTGLESWRLKKLFELEKESGISVLLLFTDKSGKIYGDFIESLKPHQGNNLKDKVEMSYFWLRDLSELDKLLHESQPRQMEIGA